MAHRLPQRVPIYPTPAVRWDYLQSRPEGSSPGSTTNGRTTKSGDRRKREEECADWGALWLSANKKPTVSSNNGDSGSMQSQIQSLRGRLEMQTQRIEELKAQALSARRQIDSLTAARNDLERDKRWHQLDLDHIKRGHASDLRFAKIQYEADLRWHKADLASARADFTQTLSHDRQRASDTLRSYQQQLNDLINTVGYPHSSTTVTTPQPALDEIFDTPLELTLPLKTVQLVGDTKLQNCSDVLPIITTFLVRVPVAPLDVAVSRGSVHMTQWLVANNAKATSVTAHAAVNSGKLEIVKAVFGSLDSAEKRHELFQELPINKSEAIAEWLVQTYPGPMAKEFVRLAAIEKLPSHSQWAWYGERIGQQWQWEQDFETQCMTRKRQRLEADRLT